MVVVVLAVIRIVCTHHQWRGKGGWQMQGLLSRRPPAPLCRLVAEAGVMAALQKAVLSPAAALLWGEPPEVFVVGCAATVFTGVHSDGDTSR